MPEFEIEQYVLYKMKYRVAAESEAEAIWRVLDEQVDHIEESLEFVEAAESYGLPADEYPELCQELSAFDISTHDVIPSIAAIHEVSAGPVASTPPPNLCVVLESEPHGRESFDHYNDLDDMLAGVKRLVERSIECYAVDGIERTVGIAIISSEDEEEET
jgi:hypothetical protein